MKQIQKGFTLIELMIVVAIIGILAAVAIPAYQDYIVKSKLSKVTSTLDPIKTALAMYFQEQGNFPTPAASDEIKNVSCAAAPVTCNGTAMQTQTSTGQFWNSLGFSVLPSLPNEVSTLSVAQSNPANIVMILQFQNVKASTIDGSMLSVSPLQGVAPTAETTASFPAAPNDTIAGSSAMQWYYGCFKGNATGSVDAVLKAYFKNGSTPITC